MKLKLVSTGAQAQNIDQDIQVSDATFRARVQRIARAPGRRRVHGWRSRRHQGAEDQGRSARRRHQAVASEGHRPGACRLDPQPDLGRRRPRVRSEAARLLAEGQSQDVSRRDADDVVGAGAAGASRSRQRHRAGSAEDQAAGAEARRPSARQQRADRHRSARREARARGAQPAARRRGAGERARSAEPGAARPACWRRPGAVRLLEERLA